MKLVLAIVQQKDRDRLIDELTEAGYPATVLASTGGFLREGNSTIMLGIDEAAIDPVMEIVRKTCHTREQFMTPIPPVVEPVDSYVTYPVKVQVGGAIVFVLNVERMDRI